MQVKVSLEASLSPSLCHYLPTSLCVTEARGGFYPFTQVVHKCPQ